MGERIDKPKPKPRIWEPNSVAQSELLSRSETELLGGGARGGGKTEAGLAWLADPECTSNPRYTSLVIRKDYDDLLEWTFRAKRFYHGHAEVSGQPTVIKWNAGGITRLGHWKDRNTIGKYIGHEYWKILCEELTQTVGTLGEYEMLLGSLRTSEPNIKPQFLGTTNPGGIGHRWVKEYWVDRATNCTYKNPETGYSRIFIPFKATDNPALDPMYVSWLDGLNEGLRQQWRDGSWDYFEGQFFTGFGPHLLEKPWYMPESTLHGRLIGALDHGINHNTSFGLFWVDREYIVHHLFTYSNNGGTARMHAREIFDRVEAFPWTHGYFPDVIVYDPSMDIKHRHDEAYTRAYIDDYREELAQRGKRTRMERANNDRRNGCQMMHMLYSDTGETARYRYWERYNTTYKKCIESMIQDPNDPEVYKKQDGDDDADMARYGMVKAMSMVATDRQRVEMNRPKTPYDAMMNRSYSVPNRENQDWFTA